MYNFVLSDKCCCIIYIPSVFVFESYPWFNKWQLFCIMVVLLFMYQLHLFFLLYRIYRKSYRIAFCTYRVEMGPKGDQLDPSLQSMSTRETVCSKAVVTKRWMWFRSSDPVVFFCSRIPKAAQNVNFMPKMNIFFWQKMTKNRDF